MIDTGFDIEDLSEIREAAGDNPQGSKLGDDERIHLIYMVAAMNRAIRDGEPEKSSYWTHMIQGALCARGLKTYHIAEVFSKADLGDAVGVADLFAVHPQLREA
ncbi:MAG: hypothetical protein IJI97_05890 [Clostridia bacterium]|nr:hypothetical protein [Clostridia bacterium]